MASKADRERLRAERIAAEEASARETRQRLLFGYVVAGVLALALVAGIIVVVFGGGGSSVNDSQYPANAHIQAQSGSVNGVAPDARLGTPPPDVQQGDLTAAAAAAGCDLQLNLEDEGHDHLTPSDPVPDYGTNPPTSGDHIEPPLMQADGAYSEFPQPVRFVHSLEHGRIEIQYSPDLPEKDQLALKGVFDASPPGMLLFPNPDMPYEVAATAWTQLMGCDKYAGDATLDAIRDFRDAYRGQGPENVPLDVPG
jgi:Protein of unknown function (DUF3105)